MKSTITGHIVAIDYARQSFNIKSQSKQTPVTVYADDKVFNKLAYRVEKDRLDGKNETRGTFEVSGKVLLREKIKAKQVTLRVGNLEVQTENIPLVRFVKQLETAIVREPSMSDTAPYHESKAVDRFFGWLGASRKGASPFHNVGRGK
jgi:hypothetical protein